MDYKTQIITAILCVVCGIYLFISGFRTIVLREKVLIFPVQFGIWLNRVFIGEEAAERLKSQKLSPKYHFYNGISFLIIGLITLILGILLMLSL